jgi:peptide/nickel transport system substrate-binding protein
MPPRARTYSGVSCLLVFILALAPSASAAVKNPGTLTFAAYADFDSLDPAWSSDMSPLFNIYESLLQFKGAGVTARDIEPLLSEKVPSRENGLISSDGLTYRFPIRKGVHFHDGSPLTPEDVRYSLLRFILTDRDGGPSDSLLLPILGVPTTRPGGKLDETAYRRAAEAVTSDGNDVVIRLAKPFAPFLSVLTNFGRVVSRNWCAAHGQWDGTEATWEKYNDLSREASLPGTLANGTGPFKLERYDPSVGELILVRNEDYWRVPARMKRIDIKTVPDFGTRKLMLAAGDADVISAPQAYAPQLKGLPGVELIAGLRKLQLSAALAFARDVEPAGNGNIGSGKLDGEGIPADFFKDRNIRQGFAYAIDYDAYIHDVLRGQGARATSVIPPGLDGHSETPPQFRFDPERAAAHFKKAWGGRVWEKGFKLTLVYPEGRDEKLAACQIVRKGVESLNPKFRIEIRGLPPAAMNDQARARKIPLILTSWTADYPDAHDFAFPLLHSAGYFAGRFGYANPEADRLIDAAAAEMDAGKRAALYRKLQAIVDEDVPFVLIADETHYRAQRSWVKGFVFNPATHDVPYGSVYYDLYKAEP